MDIKFMTIAHKVSRYNRVVLYGAGAMARKVYDGLLRCGVSTSFCVVTEKSEDLFMETIPVHELEECNEILKAKDTILLLAVSKLYETEIEGGLREAGIDRWLRFSDFIVEGLLEEYRDKTVDQCLEEIAEWKIVDSRDDWKNFESVKKKIEHEIADKKVDENKIVIAIGDLTPRVLKIIEALQNENIIIEILFFPNILVRTVCENGIQNLGLTYRKCNCVEELIYYIIMAHAEIVHMFSNIGNTIIPFVAVKMSSILPKIVYDEYDIINEFYIHHRRDWLEEERLCLEMADGVCNRGFELNYLVQECGYQINGQTMQFLDFCKDSKLPDKQCEFGEELSICYAGGIVTEREYPDSVICCWLELAEKCLKARCHLHIYPSQWSESRYKEYIELEKHNKFFHFHYPVSSEELSLELSQYDYGIHPVRSGFLDMENTAYIKRSKLIYGVTNHFFDYLDAGLPIIAASPVLFAESLEKKGVLLSWAIDDYDFEYLKENRNMYKERVKSVRKEFQVKNHICELSAFYESLKKLDCNVAVQEGG